MSISSSPFGGDISWPEIRSAPCELGGLGVGPLVRVVRVEVQQLNEVQGENELPVPLLERVVVGAFK